MVITRKILEKIENTVGHSCEAGVGPGINQGEIKIRVFANKPDGQRYACEKVLTHADHMNGEIGAKLEQFKYWAKAEFDNSFSS